MEDLTIRVAAPEDAAAILAIYAPYVRDTAITFEYEVPSLEEFRSRVEKTLTRYPYLVAQRGNAIVGYAYAGAFYPRAAYDWCAELTVYVERGARWQGIGRRLYEALEAALDDMGILNLYACIAVPETADEHLTKDSEAFHAHLGFRTVGTFRNCGYKFGRWYHMIWMEKVIGNHVSDQPPVHPFRA